MSTPDLNNGNNVNVAGEVGLVYRQKLRNDRKKEYSTFRLEAEGITRR